MMIALAGTHTAGREGVCELCGLQGRDTDVDSWVGRNYKTVLDALLPKGNITPEEFPKNVKWMVTCRIAPPYENPEYRVSMHKTYDGKIEASIVSPKGASVISQLRALRRRHPEAELEKIARMVSVKHTTVTQSDYPQLSELASQIEAMNISPILPDELGTDETGYEFWSQSLWGNRLNLIMGGPGTDVKGQPNPLIQWVETVRNVVEARTKE
jgi:hypothetical protein